MKIRSYIMTVTLLPLAGALPAAADPVADFYKGKDVNIIVGSSAGGGYDTYSRLLGRHIGEHIPGNPNIVVQNMPGGGGLVAANHIFNSAEKDGTVFGNIRAGTIVEDMFGNKAAKLDGTKVTWIGVMDSSTDSCVVWRGRGVDSPQDFLTKDLNLGASGVASRSYVFPTVMKEALGAKFKIISGYKGTPDRILAMENGELDGACGLSLSTVKAKLGHLVKEGKLKVILQNGVNKHPDFPDVPRTLDQAQDEAARQILTFVFGPTTLGRPYGGPPEIPEDRAKALQDAFMATMNDPDFLAEAKKQKVEIEPMSAAEALAFVKKIYATPKPVVEKAAIVLGKK